MGRNTFRNQFPDEGAVLRKLFEHRYGTKPCPKCKQQKKYHLVKGRRCLECGGCGNQIYPTKGTIMWNSKTSPLKWIEAIYEMVYSKNSISTIEMAARLEVCYVTARKMMMKIRLGLMADNSGQMLKGVFELDEKLVGGYNPAKGKFKVGHNGQKNKIKLFGIKQWGGPVRLFCVERRDRKTLEPIIHANIAPGSTIYTDQYAGYNRLSTQGYIHETVNHKAGEFARGPVTTQRIEGIWNQIDKAYRGTYVVFKKDHINSYLKEFEFRHNMRKKTRAQALEILTNRLFYGHDSLCVNSEATPAPSVPVPPA